MAKYKIESLTRRVPLGKQFVKRTHRPYLTEEEFDALLDGEVIVEEKVDGHPETLEDSGYLYYCEDLHKKHSIVYSIVPPPYGEKAPSFWICYDVWILNEKRWALRDEKETLCEMIGIPVSHLIYKGKIEREMILALADRVSVFGDTQIEGIVIKNYAKRLFGKFINCEFLKGIENNEDYRDKPIVFNRIANK